MALSIEESLERFKANHPELVIDYDRMKKVRPRQKVALTRAIKSGDHEKVRAVCIDAVREWDEIGFWPDDWSGWERALNDSRPWNYPYLSLDKL